MAVVLLPVAAPQVGFGILFHTKCETGSVLGTGPYWTPVAMLNSPDPGQAWANVSYRGAIDGMHATNGSSVGIFALDLWNLVQLVNATVLGPGTNLPCTSGMAVTHDEGNWTTGQLLAHYSNESDAEEVGNFTAGVRDVNSPYYGVNVFSVSFENGLVAGGDTAYDTCGTNAVGSYPAASSQYPVTMNFIQDGRYIHMSAEVASDVTYFYQFAPGHMWVVYDPSLARPPSNGGDAFQLGPGCAA